MNEASSHPPRVGHAMEKKGYGAGALGRCVHKLCQVDGGWYLVVTEVGRGVPSQHSVHACTLARVAQEAPRHRRCTSALATPTAPTARRAPSPRTAPSSLTSSCAGSEHTPAAAASTPRRRPIAPLPPAVRRSRSGHRSHARSPRLRRGAWPAGLLSHVPGHR